MRAFLALCLAVLLAGCASVPLLRFPDAPKNVPAPQYQKVERKVIEPVVGTVTIDGKSYPIDIGYREDYRYDVNATAGPEKPQTFLGWLLNPFRSGWLWILVAILLFVPGAWGIFVWAAGRVRRRLGQVVSGVETFLNSDAPEDVKKKLLDSLSKSMDSKAKVEVSRIKNKK